MQQLEGEREGGFTQARSTKEGGGGVAPAATASLLFSPLRPLINMQMKDICEMSGCQITSSGNLADFSWEGLERTHCILVFLAC